MKKTIIIILALVFSLSILGQRKGDLGVFGGTSYYLGEINPTIQFLEALPAAGIFYRHTYDLRWSIRGSAYYGKLTGHDRFSPFDFNQRRNHSFTLEIVDFAAAAEFNFLPYVTTSIKYNFAPYITAGLSYMLSLDENVAGTMAVPFGIGFKVNVTERLSAGCEWVWRVSFSDELDGLGDYPSDPLQEEFLSDQTAQKYRQKSLIYRNDKYAYTGIFISYKLFYKRYKCPAYDEKNMAE
ncbi:MAG: DUF6089 family protein [Bacteroidales bacterium]|nr:DUF6089 family protein [Bacteroidales bacterium]MCF8454412.1 DUF6089 family protein [Bacteroidales bacterium]